MNKKSMKFIHYYPPIITFGCGSGFGYGSNSMKLILKK
jgi:hypothetical protein